MRRRDEPAHAGRTASRVGRHVGRARAGAGLRSASPGTNGSQGRRRWWRSASRAVCVAMRYSHVATAPARAPVSALSAVRTVSCMRSSREVRGLRGVAHQATAVAVDRPMTPGKEVIDGRPVGPATRPASDGGCPRRDTLPPHALPPDRCDVHATRTRHRGHRWARACG